MLQHFTRLAHSDALCRSPQSANSTRSIPNTLPHSGQRELQLLPSAARFLGPSRSSLKATLAAETPLRLDLSHDSSPESWASAASRQLSPITEDEDHSGEVGRWVTSLDQAAGAGHGSAGNGSRGSPPSSMASEDLNQLLQQLEAEEDVGVRSGRRRSFSHSAKGQSFYYSADGQSFSHSEEGQSFSHSAEGQSFCHSEERQSFSHSEEGDEPEPSWYTARPQATPSLWSSGAASGRRQRSRLPDDFPVRQINFGVEASSSITGCIHPATSPLLPPAASTQLDPRGEYRAGVDDIWTGGMGLSGAPSSFPRRRDLRANVGVCTPSGPPFPSHIRCEPGENVRGCTPSAPPSPLQSRCEPREDARGCTPPDVLSQKGEPRAGSPSTDASSRSASLIRLLHDLDLEDAGDEGSSPPGLSAEHPGFSRMSPILSGETPPSHVSTSHTCRSGETAGVEYPGISAESPLGEDKGGRSTGTRFEDPGGSAGSGLIEEGQPFRGVSRGAQRARGSGEWGRTSPVGVVGKERRGLTCFVSPCASLAEPSLRNHMAIEFADACSVSPSASLPRPASRNHVASDFADSGPEDSPVLAWTTGRRAAPRRVISDDEDEPSSGVGAGRYNPSSVGKQLFRESPAIGASLISPPGGLLGGGHQSSGEEQLFPETPARGAPPTSPPPEGPNGDASSHVVIADSALSSPVATPPRNAANIADHPTSDRLLRDGWSDRVIPDSASPSTGAAYTSPREPQAGGLAGPGTAYTFPRAPHGGGLASPGTAYMSARTSQAGVLGSPSTAYRSLCTPRGGGLSSWRDPLRSDAAHTSPCTPQAGGLACSRDAPGSDTSGSLRIVAKSSRRPQFCLASDSENESESPGAVASRSPQARAPGAQKEAFRVGPTSESSSTRGPGARAGDFEVGPTGGTAGRARKDASRVAPNSENSSSAAPGVRTGALRVAANDENGSNRGPGARMGPSRVAGNNESSSSGSSSPRAGRKAADQWTGVDAARDAYDFPTDDPAGPPVVPGLGFGGAGRKPLPQAGAVLEAPGIMETLRAALPTFDKKGLGYDGDDDVIEISDSEDGESGNDVDSDDDDDGLFILNDQENTLLYPPLPTPRPTGRRPPLTPLRDPVTPRPGTHQTPGTAPLAAMTPATVAAFKRQREALAQSLYREFNARVFEGKLPENLKITWNPRLKTTAGLTYHSREADAVRGGPQRYSAHVELSSKVVDAPHKLEATLLHELCHVAAWLLDHTSKPPHGPAFKRWAQRAHAVFPQIPVTRCHHYSVHVPFEWRCQNPECGEVFKRHSRSINTARMRCGRCRSSLAFLGKFNVDGTPAKTRTASAFSLFVRDNFAAAKASAPPGTPHADVMQVLGRQWRAKKATQERAAD